VHVLASFINLKKVAGCLVCQPPLCGAKMRISSPLFGLLALGTRLIAGQCQEVVPAQYAGTPFTNSLPKPNALSNITFFKIRDPSGQHVCTSDAVSDLSVLTYLSMNSTKGRLQNAAIKRLVIVISGANVDAWNYHDDMLMALTGMADSQINADNVAILAPYFPNDSQANTGFPYNANGATPDLKYPSPAVVWYTTEVSNLEHSLCFILLAFIGFSEWSRFR
jgi:hypothetical protein